MSGAETVDLGAYAYRVTRAGSFVFSILGAHIRTADRARYETALHAGDDGGAVLNGIVTLYSDGCASIQPRDAAGVSVGRPFMLAPVSA